MDVLKRALRRRGDHSVLMFAVDSFESYVLLRAHHLNISPGEVAALHTHEIRKDLKALDIEVDLFLDPLESDLYHNSIIDRVESLRSRSAIEERKETFLYCADSSRFIIGCWLLGRCPNCGSESGGYSCEACGCHYRPEELTDKRSRLDEGPLTTVTCRTMFLRVRNTALLHHHIEQMLPPAFQKILRQYLNRSEAVLRISVPGNWGVPISVEGEASPQVVYSGFASLGLLDAFGREYAQHFGRGNPFHPDSDVTTICSFGIDNTVSRVMSCVGGALDETNFRPPDSLLLNYFYHLEGAKFSTSRNHAIWASAIESISPNISDIVRFYLLETSPEEAETEFRVSSFFKTASELFEKWNRVIEQALSNLLPSPPPEPLLRAFDEAMEMQENCLDPHSFRSRDLPNVIRNWIELGHNWAQEFPYWWLKGFAVLAWPVLPKLCSSLWLHMGHNGSPTQDSFLELTEIKSDKVQLLKAFSEHDLRRCLPPSLNA
jgi:methionyl-tRNA synthetase